MAAPASLAPPASPYPVAPVPPSAPTDDPPESSPAMSAPESPPDGRSEGPASVSEAPPLDDPSPFVAGPALPPWPPHAMSARTAGSIAQDTRLRSRGLVMVETPLAQWLAAAKSVIDFFGLARRNPREPSAACTTGTRGQPKSCRISSSSSQAGS